MRDFSFAKLEMAPGTFCPWALSFSHLKVGDNATQPDGSKYRSLNSSEIKVSLRHLPVPVVTVPLSGRTWVSGQETAFQVLAQRLGTCTLEQNPCLGPHGKHPRLTHSGQPHPEPPLLWQLCLDSRQGSNAKRDVV